MAPRWRGAGGPRSRPSRAASRAPADRGPARPWRRSRHRHPPSGSQQRQGSRRSARRRPSEAGRATPRDRRRSGRRDPRPGRPRHQAEQDEPDRREPAGGRARRPQTQACSPTERPAGQIGIARARYRAPDAGNEKGRGSGGGHGPRGGWTQRAQEEGDRAVEEHRGDHRDRSRRRRGPRCAGRTGSRDSAAGRPAQPPGRRAGRRGTAASGASDQTKPRTTSIGLRAAEARPEPAAERDGEQQREGQHGDRPARQQVPGQPDVPAGSVLDRAPAEASRLRISESAARPKRSKVSASKFSGSVLRGIDGQLAVGGQPDGGQAEPRSAGPARPARPGGRAGRDRRAGPRRRRAWQLVRDGRVGRLGQLAGRALRGRSTTGSPAERSDGRGPAGSGRSPHRARPASL